MDKIFDDPAIQVARSWRLQYGILNGSELEKSTDDGLTLRLSYFINFHGLGDAYRTIVVFRRLIKLLTPPCCLYDLYDKPRTPAILVTGGLGYIGSHVCLELLERGYTVVIIDNLSNSHSETINNIVLALESPGATKTKGWRSKIHHIPADYGDTLSLDQALSAYRRELDFLGAIHLAASKSVAESLKEPWKYYDNNVLKMQRFLDLLGRHGVENLVFSSSATVYGCLPSSEEALREDMIPICNMPDATRDMIETATKLTPYGVSKLLGESLVAGFTSTNTKRRSVIFRLFNPVGCDPSGYLREEPKDRRWCGGGVMQMIRKSIRENKTFEVYGSGHKGGDGSCVRDFVHVTDIARGVVIGLEACVRRRLKGCEVFNLASGKGISVGELVTEVEKQSGVNIQVKESEERRGDVAISVGNVDKIRRELGWNPEKGVEEVCRDFCMAYRIGSHKIN